MRRLAGVAAVLVAAGCGGDSVTRAEWAHDANEICAKYDRRFRSLRMAEELPALARVLGKFAELLEAERDELAALEEPKSDSSDIRAMLRYVESSAAAALRAQRAARSGDVQTASIAVGESDSAAAQARHEARALGALTCARP